MFEFFFGVLAMKERPMKKELRGLLEVQPSLLVFQQSLFLQPFILLAHCLTKEFLILLPPYFLQ